MTPELLEAMDVVRAGLPENIGLSHEEYLPMLDRYHAAKELLASEFVRMIDAGELVRAKGLDWDAGFNQHKGETHTSRCFFASFTIWKTGGKWNLLIDDYTEGDELLSSWHDSLEDGKAKAEQWYRARLAAALEPLTAKGDA